MNSEGNFARQLQNAWNRHGHSSWHFYLHCNSRDNPGGIFGRRTQNNKVCLFVVWSFLHIFPDRFRIND